MIVIQVWLCASSYLQVTKVVLIKWKKLDSILVYTSGQMYKFQLLYQRSAFIDLVSEVNMKKLILQKLLYFFSFL